MYEPVYIPLLKCISYAGLGRCLGLCCLWLLKSMQCWLKRICCRGNVMVINVGVVPFGHVGVSFFAVVPLLLT